jgi:hypothetical protein
MVKLLVAGGIIQDRIAAVLKISERTLRQHYRQEIRSGQTEIDAQSINALVRAMRGKGKESVVAAKWWQQSRMGWSERIVIDDPAANTPMRVTVELVGAADTESAKFGAEERDTGSRLPPDVLKNIELRG